MTDKKYYIRIASLILRVEDEDGEAIADENGEPIEYYPLKWNKSLCQREVEEEIDRFLENLTFEDVTENPDD